MRFLFCGNENWLTSLGEKRPPHFRIKKLVPGGVGDVCSSMSKLVKV